VVTRRERFGTLAYYPRLRRLVVWRHPALANGSKTRLAGLPASTVGGSVTSPCSGQYSEPAGISLQDELRRGLTAPICLTWELTYACNLSCSHCLSASGRKHPRELSTPEAMSLINEWANLKVFYVNIGGGEPLLRPDFFDIVEKAASCGVGVNFSTNGTLVDQKVARRLAQMDYVDLQVSLDGATAAVNDAIRGPGTYVSVLRAMRNLVEAGFVGFKLAATLTRHNASELDRLRQLAAQHGALLRLTRLRPSGRASDSWDSLRPTQAQLRAVHAWLVEHPDVLTGDSFFHLNALGEPLPGLNMCGAGTTTCLVDPLGDVYPCPFLLHRRFRAGSARPPARLVDVWRTSRVLIDLRNPPAPQGPCSCCPHFAACRGGCVSAKFFTGLPLEGPDPECALGLGVAAGRRLQSPYPARTVQPTTGGA